MTATKAQEAFLEGTSNYSSRTQTISPSVLVKSGFRLRGAYGDFRDQLVQDGYVVVKQAVDYEKAKSYQQDAFNWLRSFDPSFDSNDSSTWDLERLPSQNMLRMYLNYGVVHERFMWEARQEKKILDAFIKIWGTNELLVSFDGLNVTLPGLIPRNKPWPHIDQAPRKRGLHCIQGIINLSPAGEEDGSLVVCPGSHKIVEEFFDTHTKPAEWRLKDKYNFSEENMEWFKARGCSPMKVHADPGDLILWDSRTIHWGGEPTEKSDTVRTVIYVAYAPASLATPAALEDKKEVFYANGATTHWPHDNIAFRDMTARLPDGSIDPRNRSEPLEKPEQTDKLLKLAGVRPY